MQPRWIPLAAATVLIGFAGLTTAQPAPPAPAPVPVNQARADAQVLMNEGLDLLNKKKDFAGALDRFQKAYAKFPSPKVLINVAAALRGVGRLPDAANVYQRFLDDPGSDATRRAEVAKLLAEIDPKVGIVVLSGLPDDAEVQYDGAAPAWPVPTAEVPWISAAQAVQWRVGAGTFKVRARKPGFVTAEQTAAVSAGAKVALTFALVAEVVKPPPPPPDGDGNGTGNGSGNRSGGDVVVPPPTGVHEIVPPPAPRKVRLGALVEAAIDGNGKGVAITPGLTIRLADRFEFAAKALVGGSKGAYLGGTVYLLTGKLRPQISAGVPVFFSDGARLGLRGAAGVCYDLTAQVSAVGELGAEYFVNPEMNRLSFVLVPVVGVHARL